MQNISAVSDFSITDSSLTDSSMKDSSLSHHTHFYKKAKVLKLNTQCPKAETFANKSFFKKRLAANGLCITLAIAPFFYAPLAYGSEENGFCPLVIELGEGYRTPRSPFTPHCDTSVNAEVLSDYGTPKTRGGYGSFDYRSPFSPDQIREFPHRFQPLIETIGRIIAESVANNLAERQVPTAPSGQAHGNPSRDIEALIKDQKAAFNTASGKLSPVYDLLDQLTKDKKITQDEQLQIEDYIQPLADYARALYFIWKQEVESSGSTSTLLAPQSSDVLLSEIQQQLASLAARQAFSPPPLQHLDPEAQDGDDKAALLGGIAKPLSKPFHRKAMGSIKTYGPAFVAGAAAATIPVALSVYALMKFFQL